MSGYLTLTRPNGDYKIEDGSGSYYYGYSVPGDLTGHGDYAPGALHLEYFSEIVTNTISSGGTLQGTLIHILTVTDTNSIIVTDGGGCNPDALGLYPFGGTNAQGWGFAYDEPWFKLTAPGAASLYWIQLEPGSWFGNGDDAPGAVFVAYPAITVTTNTLAGNGQLNGAYLAPGSVSAESINPADWALATNPPSLSGSVTTTNIYVTNLTVYGVSKLNLPTTTNGLAVGVLWASNGTVRVRQ